MYGYSTTTNQMQTECVHGVVIDVCSKTFLLLSDQGNSKTVECDNAQEFMNVLGVINNNLNSDQIVYADPATYENSND